MRQRLGADVAIQTTSDPVDGVDERAVGRGAAVGVVAKADLQTPVVADLGHELLGELTRGDQIVGRAVGLGVAERVDDVELDLDRGGGLVHHRHRARDQRAPDARRTLVEGEGERPAALHQPAERDARDRHRLRRPPLLAALTVVGHQHVAMSHGDRMQHALGVAAAEAQRKAERVGPIPAHACEWAGYERVADRLGAGQRHHLAVGGIGVARQSGVDARRLLDDQETSRP